MLDYASSIPVAVAAKVPGRFVDKSSYALALAAALASAVTASGLPFYFAGSINESVGSAMRWALLGLLAWFVLLVCMVTRVIVLWFRHIGGAFYAGVGLAFVVALSGFVIGGAVGEMGAVQYQRGFLDWTKQKVNTSAILQWHATQPVSPVAVVVPPANWPAPIASLAPAPASVDLLPNAGGVMISWGRYGTWGDARRVFITADPAATPPDPESYDWTVLTPGVHAGVQYGG